MSGRRMGCSRRRVSVNEDVLKERNLLEATETDFFEC